MSNQFEKITVEIYGDVYDLPIRIPTRREWMAIVTGIDDDVLHCLADGDIEDCTMTQDILDMMCGVVKEYVVGITDKSIRRLAIDTILEIFAKIADAATLDTVQS